MSSSNPLLRRRHRRLMIEFGDDIAALVAALGGNTNVPAIYDARRGIHATTTVSQWDDARGAVGYAPALAQATGANQPVWDAANLLVDTRSSNALYLSTPASALFDLSGAYALVLVGTIGLVDGYSAGIADSATPTRSIQLRNAGNTNIAGVFQPGTAFPNSSVSPAGSTRRCIILSKAAGTSVACDVPNASTATGALSGAASAGSNVLTLGGVFQQGGPGFAARALLALAFQPSAGQRATILNWAIANHAAVAA